MIVSPIGELRERVAANLAAFARRAVPLPDGHRRAAVTVCVLEGEGGEPYTVVIRRAARGRNAGQWALPGGRVEDGEDAEAAALRELAEEVGITGVDVAGALDDFVTDSGFVITPFVAFGGGRSRGPIRGRSPRRTGCRWNGSWLPGCRGGCATARGGGCCRCRWGPRS
ncbi:NUDIX domain-containing protein [Thermocatellispora tengchongensis]|uniref:NUDIX domain-containing protein n=1 Tax=Thermocatellispora tengchongensis TaxID=1073253 RepID=UPI003633B0AC